ncbi:putative f-box domain-containing protein [Golovinomyces cichoracearum]|uniref:Putative f-box domain-containing protein n=1 Tax=Golovinomyces cichoracearum TaxID=62708 RepID=A0A420INW4_9PEZI|nr:putative f-box domain-containing protein [Golovinomyces cichoracearum]
MDSIPPEIFLNLVEYLDPVDIVALQLVNHHLYILARDNNLWRLQCFAHSNYMKNLERREVFQTSFSATSSAQHVSESQDDPNNLHRPKKSQDRIRLLANWDPSFQSEKVDWYREFIERNAPISMKWVQQPQSAMSFDKSHLEIKGIGILNDWGEKGEAVEGKSWLVGPVEDGSVCLWDTGKIDTDRKGNIVARSKERILFPRLTCGNWNDNQSRIVQTIITECVSVNSWSKRAYFALHDALIEIDLETLSKVRHETFPTAISALSDSRYSLPLTVGTNQDIYLFDIRAKSSSNQEEINSERLDFSSQNLSDRFSCRTGQPSFQDHLRQAQKYAQAHLEGIRPLSIIHPSGFGEDNNEIYVAGRFPSILVYDRRKFPNISWTIHSGARLSCMSWLPYNLVSVERDLARYGMLSINQVEEKKNQIGKTLIACGEYNSKGSLEMYDISPSRKSLNKTLDYPTGNLHQSIRNRQTSSASKLLAVSNHGTQIVVSDGGGNLKWFERDGFTLSRSWNIETNTADLPRGIFGQQQYSHLGSGSEDIVIKIMSTSASSNQRKVNLLEELAVWTGEKIGLVNFSHRSKTVTQEIEENLEEIDREREERMYAERMRTALAANADEVRWVRNMGEEARLT